MKVIDISSRRHEQDGIVAALKEMLQEAESGNVASLAVAVTTKNGWGETRGVDEKPIVGTFMSASVDDLFGCVGALEQLKLRLLSRAEDA